MDYNDFREFFKVHVKEYGPYRDSKMFQVFSNFLMDSYFNDSYNNITVTLIDKLVSNFNASDNIAVYELYLDMHVDVNGSKVWDVIPKLISSGVGFQRSLELTSAELFTLLDQAPNWFIDEVTLGTLYDAGELILPYKTNCILLDSTILNNLEPITQLVSELVVETFKDSKIQLFLKELYISKVIFKRK